MNGAEDTIHATCLVLGETGVLIRGRSGAGKTTLAVALVAAAAGRGGFARLVADDRTRLSVRGGRLLARPHPALAGRMEIRGRGLVAVPHEPACRVGAVVDILDEVPRMPEPDALRAVLLGVPLPLVLATVGLPAPIVLAQLDLLADRSCSNDTTVTKLLA